PETTATIGPFPALPLSAAASGSAPAPSEIIRAFSASSRIAFLVSLRVTTKQPSTTGCTRSHMRGNMLWPPAPSTQEGFQVGNTCGGPFANESAAGAAVSGATPKIFVAGFADLTDLPT